jgi:hypothetical protein
VRPSNNFRHDQSNYDGERLSMSIFSFSQKFMILRVLAIESTQLTPQHRNNFPKASPRHDADEGEAVLVNAHQQVYFD